MTPIIDGKAFAAELRKTITSEVTKVKELDVTPGLAVVFVCEDPDSQIYVRYKDRQTKDMNTDIIALRMIQSN